MGGNWPTQRVSQHSAVSTIYRVMAFFVTKKVGLDRLSDSQVGDEYLRALNPLVCFTLHLISSVSLNYYKNISSLSCFFFSFHKDGLIQTLVILLLLAQLNCKFPRQKHRHYGLTTIVHTV
jgi:hypothetical protein